MKNTKKIEVLQAILLGQETQLDSIFTNFIDAFSVPFTKKEVKSLSKKGFELTDESHATGDEMSVVKFKLPCQKAIFVKVDWDWSPTFDLDLESLIAEFDDIEDDF